MSTEPVLNPNYRANRKKFYLTYSQCPATPKQILEHLQKISNIDKYLIATEPHKKEGNHIHAYIEYAEKQDFKNCRWADYQPAEKVYHPNDGGKIRNEMCVMKYCAKESDYITNFYKGSPYDEFWNETDPEKAMIAIVKKRPEKSAQYLGTYMMNHSMINKNVAGTMKGPWKEWILHVDIENWLVNDFYNPYRPKCLIIVGATKCGKTQWARSLGTHIYWKEMTNLDKWNNNASYIVMDDIPWEKIPHKKSLLTGAGEFDAYERYGKKKTFVTYLPCIVLLNNEPNIEEEEIDYWRENSVIVNTGVLRFY